MTLKISNEPKYVIRRIIVGALFVTSFLTISKATADICWTGNGYGSCEQMLNEIEAKAKAERDAIEADRKQALIEEAAKTTTPIGEAQVFAQKVAYREYKWGKAQFACLDTLWTQESNWRSNAVSKTNDHGIPQRNMPDHTKQEKLEFLADYEQQIEWGLGYIEARYGSPCKALSFHNARNWY